MILVILTNHWLYLAMLFMQHRGLANCRVDMTIFILHLDSYWMEHAYAWCRISSGPIGCYLSPAVTQPYRFSFFA